MRVGDALHRLFVVLGEHLQMDLVHGLMLMVVSVIAGIVITLVVQYYFLVRYFHNRPVAEEPKRNVHAVYSLPVKIKQQLENNEMSSASLPVSLLFQFLFHELRHSDTIRRWLHKKLSLEFDELLTKTTIGKFFEAVTIRDMHLGTHFPDIRDITLDSIKLDKSEGHIDTVDMSIKLDYSGNFLLSVDAKMKFGKTAYLSIKVKQVNGVGRLQFTRLPYTHWSFSFYSEPKIELAVESHFQGRQLQSNITNLIVNQIKKAIKRKHTLPNYKIRYKPFFAKTDPGQQDDGELQMNVQGQLEVSCVQMSRVDAPADVSAVYCTLAVDALPCICLYLRDNAMWLMLELTLTKIRQQQLGVIFKQESNGLVSVENVTPHTPASYAGLKQGDVILAVENKSVTHVSQISKIIKAVTSVNISIKIERVTLRHAMRQSLRSDDAVMLHAEDVDEADNSYVVIEATPVKKVPKVECNEQVSKFAQTLGNFTLRKRKSSADVSSSSTRSTPTSMPNTPQHASYKASSINFLHPKKHSISEVPEIIRTDMDTGMETRHISSREGDDEGDDTIDVHRSRELSVDGIMYFGDEYAFNLKPTSKYLNVNIWGVTAHGEVLLGYTNIPMNEILSSCYNSLLGNFTKSYSFLPPNGSSTSSQSHPLMSHSGFEHVFCYGDVLLSFVWHHDLDLDAGLASFKRKSSSGINQDDGAKLLLPPKGLPHDFVRTQFHRSIHCDFCSKKIWLKDAVQCRECGMCCHKKCISKCQMSSDCTLKVDASDLIEAGVNVSSAGDLQMEDAIVDDDTSSDATPVKRVNSVHNLSLPGAQVNATQSRSLPPSPQRTPSRKQSLVASSNPFALCPAALEDIAIGQSEANEAINKLLDYMLISAADESIMETARESGRQLYAAMLPADKIEKINAMMIELKKMFDIVTTEHADLIRRHNHEDVEVERAKIAFLLGQADAKIHGLSVLMLHFCSGLQQS